MFRQENRQTGNSFFTEATNVVLFTEGGIRVTTKKLSGKAAEISVGTQVRVHGPGVRPVQVRNIVFDAKGKEVCRKDWSVSSSPATPTPDSEYSCNSSDTLQIANPKPWSPDSPNLYTLRSQLLENGKVVDQVDTKFGIKRMEIRKDGFYLNGKLTKPRGANRHQDYPWLGNAAPDNAQERDIKLLKESGFNFLRLAHYPQSKAVMDACDKCGVMVSVCVPGWQHYSSDPVFTEHVHEDLRNMVRLHRNHPSVIMWEVTLNETYAPGDEFVKECVDIAREEADGDQFFTCGDTFGKKDVKFIGYDIPYSGWRDFYDRPAHPTAPDKLYFHREYGDYEFGGESSTSRVSRGSSEEALMLQAWNHQWAHNVNWSLPYTLGDAIWAGIDHFRGFADNSSISRCGAIDYLRLPKIVASFHKSQLAPSAKPVVEIAGYWTPRPSPTKVVVYSNCDEVELLLNGKSLGRQKPDHGPDSEYGVWRPEADPMYWTKGGDSKAATEEALKNAQGQPASKTMFDRGNCRHLDHPPFSFMPVTFEPGKLEAVGFIAGKEVARSNLATPGKAAKLKLAADLHGVPLSKVGLDAVFIRAYILDAKGTVVNEAQADVRFAVTGPAEIVGIAPVEAGIASALIRTKPGAGKVEVTAKADGFKPVSIVLKKS